MESNVLTNDDFRKLLHKAATESTVKKKKPRFDGEGKSKGKKRKNYTKNPQKPNKTAKVEVKTAEDMEEEEELFYDKNKDYMKGYRDRAQERRDNKFDGNMMPQKHIYGAVAPEFGIKTLQERRDKLIEESKYLGGDMEHTHLVKGLDFALLGKVKTEITSKKIQKDKNIQQALKDASLLAKDDKIYFNSKMAKDIYNIAVIKKTATRADPKKFFANNRVAYVIEMDESIEIPTTVIRNFVPLTVEDKLSMQSTNDIVINKLIQMLSTMRQSKLNKKLSRKDKAKYIVSALPFGKYTTAMGIFVFSLSDLMHITCISIPSSLLPLEWRLIF
ncbi:hypothetical protein A3Q56_07022 [Intoshia linei]|uniref:RED-like N-terminal domain-containing protein n=1 Tax=Intoshia linei TaxID=1819745 RepID=A0A177ATB4_9BILA|nr:hypothetical protein A3Q56_07022 [Intoshia linei]